MTPPFRFQSSVAAARLLTVSLVLPGTVRGEDPFEVFLEKHCVRCHGPEKEKGDLHFDRLSREFKLGTDSHHWAEAIENVNSGEMPPKKDKEKKPTQEEIATFVSNLDSLLKEGRASRMAARPAVAHYRLSRKENQNTAYDLLGVRYDPTRSGELNEDTLWHGFERIGSELSLSPSHVDRYYRAAGTVLNRAFPTKSGEARKVRKTPAELRYGGGKSQMKALARFGIKRPLRYLMAPGMSYSNEGIKGALSLEWFGNRADGPEHSGLCRMRLQASGIRPIGGQPALLKISKRREDNGAVEGLLEFDVTVPEDSPQVYEFDIFLEIPTTLHFNVVVTDEISGRSGGAFTCAIGTRLAYIFTHSSESQI